MASRAVRYVRCMAVMTCAALGAQTSNATAADWLPVTTLSSAPAAGGGADLAMDDAGDVFATWVRGTTVQFAMRPAGGTWTPAQDLSTAGRNARTPQVAADAAGNVVVVWAEDGAASTVIRQRSRPAGGGFAAAANLSIAEAGRNARDPVIAGNRAGSVVVAWTRGNGTTDVIQAAVRDGAGGAFSLPKEVSSSAANVVMRSPAVAVNEGGDAVAAWVYGSSPSDAIEAAARPRRGSWLAPALAGTEPGDGRYDHPRVALRDNGQAMVAYERAAGIALGSGRYNLGRPLIGGWGVLPSDLPGLGPADVILGAGDEYVATWRTLAGNGGQQLDAGTFTDAAGAITGTAHVSGLTLFFLGYSGLARSPNGSVLTFWNSNFDVSFAVRPPHGGFGAALRTPPAGRRVLGSIGGALDAEGTAVVAWEHERDGGGYGVSTATFDAAPPALGDVQVPANVTTGAAAQMSASAIDRWSGATLSWSFGDGATADGSTAVHAFARAGVYDVTVTAADGAGNWTSATRSVQVSDPPRSVRDDDRDGVEPPLDCNDASAAIRPGVREVAGDGVDENCDGIAEPFPFARAGLSFKFDRTRANDAILLTRLLVKDGPASGRIVVRCRGKGCPARPVEQRLTKGRASVRKLLDRKLRRGVKIEIVLSAPGFRGIGWRLTVGGKKRIDATSRNFCVTGPANRLGACP